MALDLWNDVCETVALGAAIVAKTGKEIVQTGLLKKDKNTFEIQRQKELVELGEMFYNMMLCDNIDIDSLQVKCEKVIKLDEELSGIIREQDEYFT